MTDKLKQLSIILVPVIIMLLLVGFSYAYIRISTVQEDLNILSTLECLSVSITDKNSSINLTNAYPVSDEEGLTSTPYNFTVTNTCSNIISVDINLDVLPISTLASKHVKIALNNNYNLLTRHTLTSPTVNGATGYNLKSNIIFNPNETQTYSLQLWLDELTTTGQGENKIFNSKIVIVASPTEETLRSKILAQGGGAGVIVAKETPNFDKIAPSVLTYKEAPSNYTGNLTSDANKSIGTGYTFDVTTGRFALTNYQTNQTYGTGHIGQYTCTSTATTNCTSVVRIIEVTDTTVTKYTRINNEVDTYDYSDTGLFAAEDEYGTSYYYRGDKNKLNNNLIWGGFQWKIIRVNGDGSIRIIYNGTEAQYNTSKVVNSTGANTQVGTTSWNETNYDDVKYVGYMYGGANGVASTVRDGNTTTAATYNQTNTIVKTITDNWYKTYILDKGYSKEVADNLFCNDRQSTYGPGYGNTGTYTNFAANDRLGTNKTPTLKCGLQNDRFTMSDSAIGNRSLTHPVGLITADEASMAGLRYNTSNDLCYLRTNQNFWSMSPRQTMSNGDAKVFHLSSGGILSLSGSLPDLYGVRPVISLSPTVVATGTGSATDPFIID